MQQCLGLSVSAGLSPVTITRLEKTANDNGFDREFPQEGDWLSFASTQAPLRIWLSALGDAAFVAAFSEAHVARALEDYGVPAELPLPSLAVAGRAVTDIPSLHRLVRRAFQLSRTLPDELLHRFEKTAAGLPRTTEAERLVVQRIGQDIFREGLLEYWQGRCAISCLAITELLRASHIKPWADCTSDAERLDVFNGFLLAPHFDALFDRGFITIGEDGRVVVSTKLGDDDRQVLGVAANRRVRGLTSAHQAYLCWHRERVFRDAVQ